MIQLEQIRFQREERTILNDVNWSVNPGEHWVLLGRNGSGKTTLLELITAYQFPSSGTVRVLGHTYGQCDVREVRQRIGYISQSLVEKLTLRDPVWEVVATGAFAWLRFYQEIPNEVKDRAHQLLEEFQLGRLADQLLAVCSQGERKKIMLARALMGDPELLIMDEPCSGLDIYEREKLLQDMALLSGRDLGIVYVTHHSEEIIPLFTHVALLHEGRMIASGPKREVMTPELLSETFDMGVQVDWTNDRPWIRVP
ncbi:ATP-binding cassette domain-containing protein [Paenibacillus melissococcoides]|uniref:ATP-binding cassette domain-containing protein n=1 Tax=Paenibacillus melissococcoides TaxID=2912268 RepID=A0ABN8U6Q4_9BACL|nr:MULTISPECIES: ATP-binding cassette domain-containing protein [Paenibacillus]MEB9894415.1 ATP-binding cassette domain-containing protein [Bacillus cereus]CAH8246813.1 ATP-binding cassette domain-containing protein [Paenibacillus melissococcoides]CAH8715833.1 ATP-binding cassette domain-containing protein [Paenibacillus melissococcoides]CAH8716789.1 ATP-binding cassette domain-containing protein [Paenibacillus melissococcoides]GIO80482.1 putative ABC transporter ATP-binding protein YlmA [Paen